MPTPMNGVLNFRKSSSMTSHDVVSIARRLLQEKQIGHLGTLDPLATGVLPLAVGIATRFVEYASFFKTYKTTCLLGRATDSGDVTGITTAEASVSGLTEEKVKAAVLQLQKIAEQVPPMVSAVKSGGQKLYELARKGITVERKARPIQLEKIEVLGMELPRVTFRVTCSPGTYIRVLCQSLGEALGVGGCMETLERESVGPFDLKDSLTFEEVRTRIEQKNELGLLLPASLLVKHLPEVRLSGEELFALCQGKKLPTDLTFLGPVRILNEVSRLCAIAEVRLEDKVLKPNKVFGVEGIL